MTIKSHEDFIRVEVQVAENTVETVVEDTLSLPSHKRQCDRILKADAKPRVTVEKIEEDKIVLEGVLDVNLVYISEEEVDDNYVCYCDSMRWDNALPFVSFLDVPGAEPGMITTTKLKVKDLQVDPQDGLSVEVSAVIDVAVKVSRIEDVDLLTGCTAVTPDRIKVEKDILRVEDFIGSHSTTLDLSDELSLPLNKPNADQILDFSVTPEVVASEVVMERILLTGYLSYKVMYQSLEGAGPTVAFAEWKDTTPFETVLDIPGARPGMKAELEARAVKANLRPTSGGTAVLAECEVKVSGKVVEARQLPVLVNIISETNTEITARKETVRFDVVVGESHKEISVDGLLDLPEPHPPIGELLDFTAEAEVVEVYVGSNRVNVEGHLFVTAIYVPYSETLEPAHFVQWKEAVPFTATVDVAGADNDMDAEVDVTVEASDPDLINRETVEARIILNVTAKIKETIEREVVVEAVALASAETRPPTIVCLIIQSGDTLWKLAQRYRTTEEAILEANPWLKDEDPRALEVGWRIFIPKAKSAAS